MLAPDRGRRRPRTSTRTRPRPAAMSGAGASASRSPPAARRPLASASSIEHPGRTTSPAPTTSSSVPMRSRSSRGDQPRDSTSVSQAIRRRSAPDPITTASTRRLPSARADGGVPDDLRDLGAGRAEDPGRGGALLGRRHDHRTASGGHAVHAGQTRGAPCEEHAGQVVAREDAVDLHGAGRRDHPAGLDVQDLVGTDHRHERPGVEPDGRVAFEDRRAGRARLGGQRVDLFARGDVPRAGRQPVLLDQQRRRARGRRLGRRREAGDPAAHDQHVDVHGAHRLLGARGRGRQPADARRPADHPLGERPREPRPDEGLRVEGDRHQPVQPVGHVQRVVLGGGPAGRADGRPGPRAPASRTRARPAARPR